MTQIGGHGGFIERMRTDQVGRRLDMTGVNIADQAAVVRAIQDTNHMQSWEALYAIVEDGPDLELYLVVNPGAFIQEVTGGRQFPDLTITFYALDAPDHLDAQAVLADLEPNPV